ncbi:MAG: hypothetical protein ABW277_01560 [Longimicrobiaceae bacterium]
MTRAEPISPWGGPPQEMLTSPDGAWSVTYSDSCEIAMGAPVSGTLTVSNGMEIRCCNGSLVWSGDSRYLAVPQWTRSRMQRLVVVDLPRRRACYTDREFNVLELHSFANGVISGIDSPVHRPAPVAVTVGDLDWSRGIAADPYGTDLRDRGNGGKWRAGLLIAAAALLLAIFVSLVS